MTYNIIENLASSNTQSTKNHSGEYSVNYVGSKQKLNDWIWENTPKGITSVFDAFSGAATLSYMYKSKGLKVVTNDRLRYCHHIAKAIVENSFTYLDENDIKLLCSFNPNAGTFVRDTFGGLYFGKGVHSLIDQYRANCDHLNAYKRDIALFALGNTCINMTCGFGHFTSTSSKNKPLCTRNEFKDRFQLNLHKINSLVFDNGQQNKAFMMNVLDVLPLINTDLVFFDPPYATEFSVTNYEKTYHFVEGLMTYWNGKKINNDSKLKCYEITHTPLTKENVHDFFLQLFEKARHIPNWMFSYRDHSYPTEKELKTYIESFSRTCIMKRNQYHYSIAGKNTPASNSEEYLFIAKQKNKSRYNLPRPAHIKYVIPNHN